MQTTSVVNRTKNSGDGLKIQKNNDKLENEVLIE